MNSTKKNIRKTSGTRNRYKPGQLVTINHRVFRIVKTIGAQMIVCVNVAEIMKNIVSVWNCHQVLV